MNSIGKKYAERWAMAGHDGLTDDHLEGARRLGWLTDQEVKNILGKESDGD